MAKNDFQYGAWNSYTLQCGTIMTLVLPGDCTLQCGRWFWDDMPLNSPWTSPILEFYIWFRFRPYHCISRHVILHQSATFYPNRTTLGIKKMTSCRFSRWRISAIVDFRGPIMGSLKSARTTSYRSSIETIALNCLVFENIAFLKFGDRQTNKQRNKQTDEQMDTPVA